MERIRAREAVGKGLVVAGDALGRVLAGVFHNRAKVPAPLRHLCEALAAGGVGSAVRGRRGARRGARAAGGSWAPVVTGAGRLALGAATGALLAGCTWVVNSAQCVLEYIVPGEYGTIGRRMGVEWGTVPVAHVEFNGYTHVLGNGTTGTLELFDEGFLVVSIQDSMKLDAEGVPKRWTNANHYQMQRDSAGRLVIYDWSETVGRAGTVAADEARAGRYPARRRTEGLGALRRWVCRCT